MNLAKDWPSYVANGWVAVVRSPVPETVLEALDRWVMHGIRPGGFLTSVLENDFVGAVCRADRTNIQALHAIALYVTNVLPSACWGTRQKMDDWQRRFSREEEADDRDPEGNSE